ncbi:MAG TPA: 2-amino-4-hydroxy-6-hydroxymethyldihydropteridine diphosphokinase [Bryobacteraceae bacterium]|jgi:2-amino-4-hydroxy-6-hydroxymethyldihydropteridine diphosphokinase|nr:2-amino-4-hydroxy-6-hydroxymethyldihydropteridine diphosphokinase [Bryobacteraceae bacterium]
MRTAYLSLGSNLGDRRGNLEIALEALERERVHVIQRSSIYETEPQDVKSQPWFLNIVVLCETTCFPIQLLGLLQRVEREMGRVRHGVARRGPRLIDIDILLFGNAVMETSALVIPHPRMFERRFVLEPLLEIAPDLKHPETKEPVSRYLSRVKEQKIRKL